MLRLALSCLLPVRTPAATPFTYQNDTAHPVVVYVEPWGADYTVLPGQQLRVLAEGRSQERPHFQLHHGAEGLQLWCESTCAHEVFVDGMAVDCGHNRASETDRQRQEDATGTC
jgi:hypothetical protein